MASVSRHWHYDLWVIESVRTQTRYRGSATIKQADFGIKPISIGGGTIKVKDEVKIDFDIVTRQP